MQPHQQGSYLRPNQAVAYADLKTIIGYTKVTPIEFGQEVYAITFENFNARGAVVDANEKARVEKLIADSQNPWPHWYEGQSTSNIHKFKGQGSYIH